MKFTALFTILIFFLCNISHANEASINNVANISNKQLDQQIDIESLGLDDIDDNKEKKNSENNIKNNVVLNILEDQDVTNEKININTQETDKNNKEKNKEKLPEATSKIRSLLKKLEDKISITNKIVTDKITGNNSKEIVEKASVKNNEITKKNEITKIDRLRLRYSISNINENKTNIIPIKKNINKFSTSNPYALPILSNYRTNDNKHIPIISTPKMRIDNLFEAIALKNVGFFNSAYKYIQNPNIYNRYGDNIITYSIINQSHATLISAINKGANPDLPNKLGYMPVQIAIELNDFESLKILLDSGANINYSDSYNRNYLFYASRVGMFSAVDYFVQNGIDINQQDVDGFTALAIAHKYNRNIIKEYLIKNGAKTWIKGNPKNNKYEIMQDLVDKWSY
ncbi:MAG: hypothetical protein CMP18_01070 [Rickettsiales bacterium]|jgi:ankyrin repeat protein|nr:hypothetical protein [Rickettsiales bacterium]|tara:strand:- start:15811 stop:17010 length:1200 start_codon:yes stop_codon:yes gene_type:complete